MFFMSRSHLRSNPRQKREYGPSQVRPQLETLEDRLTPSGASIMPATAIPPNGTPAPAVQAANQLNFAFTPNRLIYTVGSTSVNIAATLTDSSGAAVNGGTVTFTVTNNQGTKIGTPVAAAVSTSGQVSATYALPANLPMGDYTLTGVYSNSGSAYDGASATAILDIVLGPIPAQHLPSASSQTQSQSQVQIQTTPSGQSQGQPPTPLSLFQAAFTLYVDGFELAMDTMHNRPTEGTQASIDAAMASAGPYGSLFELAGEFAAYQMAGNTM